MNYKNLLTLISLSTLVSSCEDKITLQGERKELIFQSKALNIDKSIQAEKVELTKPIKNPNWTMQGYNSTQTLPNLFFSNQFNYVTSFDGGVGNRRGKLLLYSPLIQNDMLYTMDTNGKLKCFNIKDRNLVWEKDYITDPSEKYTASATGMSIWEDKGYLTLSTNQGLSIKLHDGDIIWKQRLSDISRIPPRVYDDTVFYINIDNTLEARDTKTGQLKWTHQSIQEEAILLGGTNVTVTPNYVVAPFSSGEIVVLNHGGSSIWNDQISNMSSGTIVNDIKHIYAPVVADNAMLFTSSQGGCLIAYNISTGKRIWEQPILTLKSPVVTPSHMFVLDNQQRLICLKKMSGQVKWIQQLDVAEADFSVSEAPIYWYGPLLLSDQLVAFSSNGQVIIFNPDNGDIIKKINLDYQIAMAPIVVDGKCYITTPNNTIIVYE